jgi:hypothetical protein
MSLGTEELRPGRTTPHRWGIDAVAAQDGPDGRRSKDDSHPDQFTLDPAVTPGGVLSGQSKDDCDSAGRDARSTGAVGVNPFSTDQVPVPPEQGLGFDEEPHAAAPIKEPTQPGEQGSIGRVQGWAVHLAT